MRHFTETLRVAKMVAAGSLLLAGCGSQNHVTKPQTDLATRYEHASHYLPWTLGKAVRGMSVAPQWSDDGRHMQYPWETPTGSVAYEVELATGERREIAAASGPESAAARARAAVADDVVVSPNGRWGVKVIEGNLYRIDLQHSGETRLTSDAQPDYAYGLVPQWASASLTSRLAGRPALPYGLWSPEGDRFLTYRVDERQMYKLPHVVPIVPGARHQVPYVHFQNTAWPDSKVRQEAELMVFDLRTGGRINLDIPKPGIGYGPTPEGGLRWSRDGSKVYAAPETRDFRTITLYEADAATGQARAILSDGPAKTALQPDVGQGERILPMGDGAEFIVYSERSDWGHYYLYDGWTGELRNAITQGEWAVHGVAHIDEAGRWLYFLAGGREQGHDPYYSHLYRVRFDGSELTLLTPENTHHKVQFSPDGRYFIDSHSTVSEPVVHVLRANDGRQVTELGKADTTGLEKLGWTAPVRFTTRSADGGTDLYGVLFLPSDFDPRKSYPLINAQYGANFTTVAPRAFLQDHRNGMALAQLGFVVMSFDGRGTPLRSQSAQDLGWGNWDLNLEDQVAAIKQLAARHRFIDLDRVGIYGHSAGGFSAVHGMLQHPELFKVGVATAGSHDFNLFIYPVNRERGLPSEYPEHFEPTNFKNANRLQGKLLLGHGYLDDNVHVGVTLQMADALIRANKDFDLFIHPALNHQTFYRSGYVNRKLWNYFVQHLLGQVPPEPMQVPDA